MVRHFRTRAFTAVAGAVALTMLAGACSSSKSGAAAPASQQLTAGWQGLNPGTGAPQRGGTLNMVGISDVDYMDYDTAYYTTDIIFQGLARKRSL